MKDLIKFQIASLQRSKIIMATEAVAVNTSVVIGIYLVNRYVSTGLMQNTLIMMGGLFGIGYALYASFGNVRKHQEIKRLEKKLNK
jgi:hypothetical protein